MTTETFTPSPPYTVSSVGPYGIVHPYQDGAEILVEVWQGTEKTQLVKDVDYSVVPDVGGSTTTGDVSLLSGAEITYAGQIMLIRRETLAEQGWKGLASAREVGLEVQLDRNVMALQDVQAQLGRAIKVSSGEAADIPGVDARKGKGIRFDPITGDIGLTLEDPDAVLSSVLGAVASAADSEVNAAASEGQAASDAAAAAASASLAATFNPADFVPKTGGVFSGDIEVYSATPAIRLTESDMPSSQDNSRIIADAGTLKIQSQGPVAITGWLGADVPSVPYIRTGGVDQPIIHGGILATETVPGIVEKATIAEAEVGTADGKYPDVVGVKAAIAALRAGGPWEYVEDLYDFAVDGIVSNAGGSYPESDYEYMFFARAVNMSSTGHIQMKVWKTEDSAFHADVFKVTSDTDSTSDDLHGAFYFEGQTTLSNVKTLRFYAHEDANIVSSGENHVLMHGGVSGTLIGLSIINFATPQTIGLFQFKTSSGSFNGGVIEMWKRKVA